MKANLAFQPVPPLINESIEGKLKSVLDFLRGLYEAFSSIIFSSDHALKSDGKFSYELCSDAELVALLQDGDKDAFEFVYKSYTKVLYSFARKNLSSREECEEIVQDIFVSLWERHRTLNILTIRPYLFNAVRYQIIHCIRSRALRRKYIEHFALFEAVYDTLPEESRDADTITTVLAKGIAELPDRCQQAINLRLSEDLSNGEIAKRMNISRRTVETYMHKAFDHLRNFYPKAI
jgi:RNA polymerase sigma-70 factor (ECF subfamily)